MLHVSERRQMNAQATLGVRLQKLYAGLKVVGASVAVGSLTVAVLTYFLEVWRHSETRRIEASRPYLDKQLAICTELTQVASFLAVRNDHDSRWLEKQFRFHELYAGEATLVYGDGVKSAIDGFYQALQPPGKNEQFKLIELSRKLAGQCRDELASAWRTDLWRGLPSAASQ